MSDNLLNNGTICVDPALILSRSRMSQNRENRAPGQTLHELVARVQELEAENTRLRKIAAHVPVKVYIAAKEAAGFGIPIKPA